MAYVYLRERRFNIVDRNFRCSKGEIDLIVRKDKAFRFIEVKYRRTPHYGLPQDSVVKKKQRRIRNAAVWWLMNRYLPLDSEMHFDVLAIIEEHKKTKYEYIQDAF